MGWDQVGGGSGIDGTPPSSSPPSPPPTSPHSAPPFQNKRVCFFLLFKKNPRLKHGLDVVRRKKNCLKKKTSVLDTLKHVALLPKQQKRYVVPLNSFFFVHFVCARVCGWKCCFFCLLFFVLVDEYFSMRLGTS